MTKTKDEQIDMLLAYMKDEIESKGHTPNIVRFDFDIDKGEDYLAFKEKTKLNSDEIQKTLKVSYSRGYIKYSNVSGDKIYRLTTEGQGRAISIEAAESYKEKPQQQTISIGTIHGPTQIGDKNTQNIEGVFEYLLSNIEKSEAPEKEKEKAKGLLRKALEHPITSSIIGASVGALITKIGGGNS
ncbi:MAG: hypothetical protein ACTSQH_10780 [Candidatus Hodarchaeales archaeon]